MVQPAVPPSSALATPLPRVFQPRRTTPADVVRPTRAEISLANLRANLRALERHCSAPIWCVLKADGYGHGAKACARTLERAGAKGICVALLEEGIELRNAGIAVPVLVMGGFYGRAYSDLLAHDLTPVVCDAGQVQAFASEVRYRGMSGVPVHVKVDTGMGRLGMVPADVNAVAAALSGCPELALQGLMTHFAQAGEDRESVSEQMHAFDEVTAEFARRGVVPLKRHAANTAALLHHPETHLDLVRPGIGIFGIEPGARGQVALKPVMRVLSTVIALRDLQPGQSVGYGGTWTAARPSRIATLPIGYADGLSRNSNGREVLVSGRRAKVVGTVSMDLTTIDVTDIPDVKIGDQAVVMGEQRGPLGSDVITANEIAALQGTIPWEVLTQVSRRVPRFYRDA